MTAAVKVECDGPVAIIRLAAPESGNALSLALSRDLADAVTTVASDSEVRCVLLTGTGRFFCVGGDIAAFAAAGVSADRVLDEVTGHLNRAILTLTAMAKPLVVAVNGPAAGAGVGLAALGDIVLAADTAHFTMAYTAVGLTPDGGTTILLPRLIGLRRAQEMALTNRRVSAPEAAQIGLITRAVTASDLEAEALSAARQLANGPTGAIASVRRLLADGYHKSLAAQLENEALTIGQASISKDGQEGMAAFLSKRTPVFDGERSAVLTPT